MRASPSRICQVLVVGAGPAGLVAGITLARYGIDVLVVDKRDSVSGLSRSLVISTRGMELMRRFGLETPVRSGAADVKVRAWVTPSLTSGEGTEMPLGYPSDAEVALASPTRPAWVAQDHHEPILLENLRTLPSARIRFGWQLQELTEDDDGVHARLVNVESREVEHADASFLIAADGAHSTVREQLGIPMIGPDDLANYERVEFAAALWQVLGGLRYGLYVITRSDAPGVMMPRGAGDRWSLARETPVGSAGLLGLSNEERIDLLRRAVGSEDLHPHIERVVTWSFAAQMAERYATRRCFLVGDAAHRMTPRGGTGMNTAIQDSFDLGWKLAWHLRGWAGPEVLATYELERRPVAAHNVHRAAQPTGARRETDEALRWDLNGRLPHRWLPARDGERSTVDLVGDGFTLLAGRCDPRWLHFASSFKPNAPLDTHLLESETTRALGLKPEGALLTRPDGRELRRWAGFDTAVGEAAELRHPDWFLRPNNAM